MSEELSRKLIQRRHISERDCCPPQKVIVARHEPSELEDTSDTAKAGVEQDDGPCCRDTQQADPQGFDAKRQFSVTDELESKLRRQLQLAEGDQGGRYFETGPQPSGSGSRSGSDTPIAGTGESPARTSHTEYYLLDATDSPPRSPKSFAQRRTCCGATPTMLVVLVACMTTLISVPAWVSQPQAWYDVRLRNIMSSFFEWSFSRDVDAPVLDKASANGSRESHTAMESFRPTGNVAVREPPVGGNPECWHSGFTWEICCSPELGPAGNEHCWDAIYTFHHCCVGGAGDLPAAPVARP